VDVTGFSHEISESTRSAGGDDGVHDITPWWLAPNGNCQNDLESGDVVRDCRTRCFDHDAERANLPSANEALLQWFGFSRLRRRSMGLQLSGHNDVDALSARRRLVAHRSCANRQFLSPRKE